MCLPSNEDNAYPTEAPVSDVGPDAGWASGAEDARQEDETMAEFLKPLHEGKDGSLTAEQTVAELRQILGAEEEAVQLYKRVARMTSDERARKLLVDIAEEEQVHAGEVQKMIETLEPGELDLFQEGRDEAAKLVFESEDAAMQHLANVTGKRVIVG